MAVFMLVDLKMEPKEDVTGDGTLPGIPTESELAGYLRDLLVDASKHDGRIGWRIVGVDTSA